MSDPAGFDKLNPQGERRSSRLVLFPPYRDLVAGFDMLRYSSRKASGGCYAAPEFSSTICQV